MTTEHLDLPYADDELRAFVEDAVARPDRRRRPRFYVVTGSRCYGFATEDSDVDVRGFHTVPAAEYAALETPTAEVAVNLDGATDGFEAYADVELRSYELRRFGDLLYQANYDVVEVALAAPTLWTDVPHEVAALRDLVREHLPMNVPHAYRGLARSVYDEHADTARSDDETRPKPLLYAYRALLAARYVLDREAVEVDVHALAEAVDGGDPDLVADLVACRRGRDCRDARDDGSTASSPVPDALAERAREAIDEQFEALEDLPRPQKDGYRQAIDEWMRTVRE